MEKHEEESLDFTYDVFISFRGEDTRYKFVGHVHKALCKKGIKTFIDDKNLGMRDTISPALSKAIEESRIFLVVFSENYASSTWCLDELVKIIECKKRDQKRLFFPIFYHVEPSDIRHVRSGYGKHMTAHQTKFGEGSHKVEDWKLALSEASNFPGMHIASGSDRYESDLIEEIAEKLFKNIGPKPLRGDQNPVGLEDRIEEAKSLLDMKSDDVKMLGIYGLGGIGKTELAKALFDKIVRNFDAASFLADVREKSNKINGLEDLQKTLLSEMKDELEAELGSTSRGVSEIKQRLRQKKVLLVLDDVDEKDKLEKLAGGRDWFGKGSRIIITTRDKDVLIGHKVEEMYEMKELNEQHSLELFCWNAFKQSQPKEGFENVSLRAAGFAKSLPLALKVIGSDLAAEETLEDWESALEDYERGLPNEKILNVLKTSYDRLGSKPKQVFLDIACFFKGAKREYVESILEEFGATSNIKLLCKKSLLTIEDGFVKMHDLIQDMGKDVVEQESSNPGERSRLWDYDNVIDVLNDDLGSDKIEGILLDPSQRKEEDWSGTAFEKMKRLRILIVRNISLLSEPQCLPNHLRVLDWEKYPSNSFPPKFHPKKIIIFNLPKSHLTLQKPFKEFSCLIKMDFSSNQCITEMPDVSQVQNLREMKLDNCRQLVAVHESVGFLKRLAHLSASGCTKLRSFLKIMFLPSLEVLNLNLCVELEQFPEIKKEMKTPLKIHMISTAIQELPESISNLIGLVSIEMSNSRKLKYLPSSLFMLPNVVTFIIEGCPHLQESFKCFMPSPSEANVRPKVEKLCVRNANLSDEDLSILYCFPNLKELIASDNYFESLPTCIKECVNLTILDVSNCSELQNIPECTKLRVLDVHRCYSLEEISELPSTIQKVDARFCSSLSEETLDMLWLQVKKEIRGIEVVMPLKKEIPAWFDADFEGNEGNPHFWVRGGGKFPNVALALVFQLKDISKDCFSRRQLVDLSLLINGQHVPRKGHYNFIISESHVLICDLGRLFSDEEWNGLDAFLNREWNVVTLLHEATSNLKLSRWGAFVYRSEKTNKDDGDDDVHFTCPNPEYSDTSLSLKQFPTNDPKWEYINMIQTIGLDINFEKTQEEYLKLQETGSFHGHTECMNTLLSGLSEISEQAKQSLESQFSALDDPNSKLRWILDTIKNIDDNKMTGENELYFNDDLVMIHLKDPVELNNGNGYCYNPERQRRRKIFREGMTEGLAEAQKSFPSLNIVKTRVDTDNMIRSYGTKLFDIPEEECPRLELSIEKGLRIEGIVNALIVAKLSFYDLDVWATLDAILCREGMEGFHERLHPFVLLDPTQQQIMSHAFSQGMTDGLVEAQKSFPSLDIRTTKSAALNKGIIYTVSSTTVPPQGEMRIYVEGVVTGLVEAKLSFPNLDVWETLKALLSKKDMNRALVMEVSKGEASSSGHQGSDDPQLQQITSQIYCQGMTDGLVEAHKSFPSLDIDTTKSAALNKGIIYRVSSTLPEPQGKLKIYIEGVINGLLEAKLSFPNLNQWDTLTTLLNKKSQNGASTSGHQGSDEPNPQQNLWQRFCEGMTDGLVEAQISFPSLDIHTIASAALKKGNIYRIGSTRPEPQGVEMTIYIEGVVNGLHEAKLTFPYLDVWGTLYSLLGKKNMNGGFVAPVLPSVLDKDLVRALRDTYLSDHVGEALTSGDHQGSDDPHQDPKMMKIFCDGMRDGLVEAKNIFSSLDIDTTTSAALNNIPKLEWPLSGPPGYPPLRDEIKMYTEGIYNGLRQAKLTFPDLDSEAIFNIVYMRTSMAATLPTPLLYSTCYGCKCETNYDKMGAVLKDKAEEFGREYDAWIEAFHNSSEEELHDLLTAAYFGGLREGLLEAQAIYTKTKTGDCIGGCKYEKMGAVLKARFEESGRLYDVRFETFQNSDEFHDLPSAAYTNGLWNGLLQAEAIFLAFYMSII